MNDDLRSKNLLAAYKAMPLNAQKRILATLQSDRTILSHRWVARVEGKWCGCLMMDGYDIEALPRKAGRDVTWINRLAKFYRIRTDTRRVQEMQRKYDQWASSRLHNNPHSEERRAELDATCRYRVLTPEGRQELLELLTGNTSE